MPALDMKVRGNSWDLLARLSRSFCLPFSASRISAVLSVSDQRQLPKSAGQWKKGWCLALFNRSLQCRAVESAVILSGLYCCLGRRLHGGPTDDCSSLSLRLGWHKSLAWHKIWPFTFVKESAWLFIECQMKVKVKGYCCNWTFFFFLRVQGWSLNTAFALTCKSLCQLCAL